MANFVFDYGKGRGKEFYMRAKGADPATAALLVVILASTGIETDAALKVKTSLADVLSGATDEATNTGYARKVLNSGLATVPTPDTTNHWWQCTIPVQTWTGVAADGTGAWGKLIICYRNATADADSAIIPLSAHDFAITPNGGDITATPSGNGFFRAGE